MSSSSPEIHDQREAQDGYLNVQRWIREQPDDLILKLNMIVHGKDQAVDLRKKTVNSPVRFLVHYLHHLHEKGRLDLFEEIYKEYFSAPTANVDSSLIIPQVEDIISNFESCCSSPQLNVITRLEFLLIQLQHACEACGINVPNYLTQLKTILKELKQAVYNYEDVQRDEQNLTSLQRDLESATEQHRKTFELSLTLNRRKTVKKKDRENIDEMIIQAKLKIEDLTEQVRILKARLATDAIKQKLKTSLTNLRAIDSVQLRQELKDLTDSIEKAKKAAEKRIPVPIHGASVVYLCIEHEHVKHGKSGDVLIAACAKDFADALVHSQSVDFDDSPPSDAGILTQLIYKLVSKIPEVKRQTANDILSEFPFLNGLTVDSDSHAIEEHMDKKPMVKIEDILQLIGYLRFEATAKRDQGSKEGVGRQDLKALLDFVRNLEHIVIKRLTDGAFSQIPLNVKPYKRAADIADNFFLNSVAVKKHLKSLPKRHNEKGEGGVIDTIRNFIKDAANTVGKPNSKDGPVVSTSRDALRRVAGLDAGSAEKAKSQEEPDAHESEHP